MHNPPIETDQFTVLGILCADGYEASDIQFLQPHAGNSSLVVRYKYWQEISSKSAISAIKEIYPDAYIDSEEKEDRLPLFTLTLK